MTISPPRRFLISAPLALSIAVTAFAPAALAKTVQVGACLPSLQTYATISNAVTSVPPGSTIMVCPGNYPEQVTITQPLTLKGVQSEGTANPVVVVPPGGLTQSVTLLSNGVTAFFQIVVQGTETGQVNISNLAIDGTNNGVGVDEAMLGVLFQNSSGTVRQIATYNQIANGSGFGIFLESTTSPSKTITISDSSVHDFDSGGIRCNCNSGMTVDIDSNAVVGSNVPSANPPGEAIDMNAPGKITNNSVISNPAPPASSAGVGIAFGSNMVVSGNTVVGWGAGIWTIGDSSTIKSNRVLKAGGGITLSGSNNDVEHNFLSNFPGGAGISFNCTGTGNTVIHNVVNDAYWGIVDPRGTNTTSPNTFTNVANVTSGSC